MIRLEASPRVDCRARHALSKGSHEQRSADDRWCARDLPGVAALEMSMAWDRDLAMRQSVASCAPDTAVRLLRLPLRLLQRLQPT